MKGLAGAKGGGGAKRDGGFWEDTKKFQDYGRLHITEPIITTCVFMRSTTQETCAIELH